MDNTTAKENNPMETSSSIASLAAALSAAQGEITGARKDSTNPFFTSKYADLASCWEACRAPLAKNGLSVVQTIARGEPVRIEWETKNEKTGEIQSFAVDTVETVVITTLMHASGEWIRSPLPMIPRDASPQGIGSAITYGRRYGLTALLGIAQVDDDGHGASHGEGRYAAPRGASKAAVHTAGAAATYSKPQAPAAAPQGASIAEVAVDIERLEGQTADAVDELLEAAHEGRAAGITQIWDEIKANEYVAKRVWEELQRRSPDLFATIKGILRPIDTTPRGPKPAADSLAAAKNAIARNSAPRR
nr:ERF family protein [uncultured Rhodopila sp.]